MLCSRCKVRKAERKIKVEEVYHSVCVGCGLKIDAALRHPATSRLSASEIVLRLGELYSRRRRTDRDWQRA